MARLLPVLPWKADSILPSIWENVAFWSTLGGERVLDLRLRKEKYTFMTKWSRQQIENMKPLYQAEVIAESAISFRICWKDRDSTVWKRDLLPSGTWTNERWTICTGRSCKETLGGKIQIRSSRLQRDGKSSYNFCFPFFVFSNTLCNSRIWT